MADVRKMLLASGLTFGAVLLFITSLGFGSAGVGLGKSTLWISISASSTTIQLHLIHCHTKFGKVLLLRGFNRLPTPVSLLLEVFLRRCSQWG